MPGPWFQALCEWSFFLCSWVPFLVHTWLLPMRAWLFLMRVWPFLMLPSSFSIRPPSPPPPLHPFPHLPTLPFSPLLLPLSPTCIGPDLGRSRQPDRVCHNLLQIRVCIQGKNLAVPWDQFKNSSVFEGLACLFHFFQFFNVLHSNQKPGFA